jgi:hypothetical protein
LGETTENAGLDPQRFRCQRGVEVRNNQNSL